MYETTMMRDKQFGKQEIIIIVKNLLHNSEMVCVCRIIISENIFYDLNGIFAN